jgi:lantibiotic modifying enzyme
VTGERGYLRDARDLGDRLVEAAQAAPNGGYYWDVAPPWPGEANQPYLGMMHGVAGMGLALAELASATGEEGYFGIATGAANLLLAEARVTEEGAMSWSRHLWDTSPGPQAHCHGAGGIGQFFLEMNRLAPEPRYRAAAEGAARTLTAQMETETRSGLCHGLSGTGNLLLNVYQALGREQWLDYARSCGSRLQQFRVPAPDVATSGERGDGDPEARDVYALHGDGASSPDLMLGYAGVGSFLLRLADPETAPDLIFG